jgi:hypothetical protein
MKTVQLDQVVKSKMDMEGAKDVYIEMPRPITPSS